MKNRMHEFAMFYGAKPNIFEKATLLKENMTDDEKLLWDKLRKTPEGFNQLGVKFRRQHPIGNFIADFYCHKYKLVIEIDGGYHLSKFQKEYDKNREDEMKNHGITTLRFTNEEVNENLERVVGVIKKVLIKMNNNEV